MNVASVLCKAEHRESLSREDLIVLLSARSSDDLETMFHTARKIRHREFSNKIFLYAFVYFSTYCKNACNFCLYRKGNPHSPRYRRSFAEISEAATQLVMDGVHLIDLTMGEDSTFLDTIEGLHDLLAIVYNVKEKTGCTVMISPGVVPDELMFQLRQAGADWYACYQETFNRSLFAQLRPEQDFDRRQHTKVAARNAGLLIEEGMLTEIGETASDIADFLMAAKAEGASQIRTMTFVPQIGTPMGSRPASSNIQELINIAVTRIYKPDCLIPASLDIEGLHALDDRLNAGANVITSIVPGNGSYAGVAQATMDVDNHARSVQTVLPILSRLRLEVATREEYLQWIALRR